MKPTKPLIYYLTEVDHDEIGGAPTTDKNIIRSLQKLAEVDVVYLRKKRFKSIPAALLIFAFDILKSLRKPYATYFSRGMVAAAILILLKPIRREKIVLQTLSVPFPSNEVRYMSGGGIDSLIRYCLFRFLERNIIPRVDVVTVASEEYAQEIIELGVDKDKVLEVPLGVDEAFFRQGLKNKAGPVFTFGYVGRFHRYHVLVPVVQAFDTIQRGINAELLLVGDGIRRPEVEKEVAERRLLGKIKFLGMIPQADLPSFLSRIDCFVLLSEAPGMPIGILEAAAAAKPIITLERKNDKALDRYFTHGKDVYMVERASPEEIAHAMLLLYKNSKLRNTLASGARKVAKDHFSEETVIQRLRDALIRSD